jgi:hypothetical protein
LTQTLLTHNLSVLQMSAPLPEQVPEDGGLVATAPVGALVTTPPEGVFVITTPEGVFVTTPPEGINVGF